MEEQGDPLKGDPYPPNLPDPPRTFLHGNRLIGLWGFCLIFGRRLPCRKVLSPLGGNFFQGAAIALVWLVVICLDWRGRMKKQNPHCEKTIVRTPLVKVLEILKNFFQEVFKWGLGQSPEVFPTYIRWRSERRQAAAIPIPLDGIGRETSGMGRIKPATQNPHCVKPIVKPPLVKVLESPENFFQEVFWQGLGQSPKVFYAL